MSLATRCTACGTAFRVVQDQLKVSEGWVRCGRCSEVFNALEGLFDLERETPPEWQEAAPDGEGAPARDALETDPAAALLPSLEAAKAEPDTLASGHSRGSAGTGAAEPDSAADEWADAAYERESTREDQIDAHLFGARKTARRGAPAAHVSERDRLDFSDARFASDLLPDAVATDAPSDELAERSGDSTSFEVAMAPEFVRRAESRARWQRPRTRAALGAAALLLAALLAVQTGHHFRDTLAARSPSLQSLLSQWCVLAACTLEAPRRIEDLSVESTALTKAPGGDSFRLGVTLRSRGSVPVSLPWIDLSLTDASGKLIARKALAAHEFNPPSPVLAPGAEVVLQMLLAARNSRVTGYTVEIFYP